MAVDGGAYKGEWTGTLRQRFGKVYAFEPQPIYADRLSLMFPDVVVVNAALMDRSGTGVFIVPPRTHKVPFTDRSTTVIRQETGGVSVVRLDDFPIENCGLIKLNVEGCEPFVLEGARGILVRDSPVVIMEESHPKKLPEIYKQSPGRARSILDRLGYRQVARDGHDTIWALDDGLR